MSSCSTLCKDSKDSFKVDKSFLKFAKEVLMNNYRLKGSIKDKEITEHNKFIKTDVAFDIIPVNEFPKKIKIDFEFNTFIIITNVGILCIIRTIKSTQKYIELSKSFDKNFSSNDKYFNLNFTKW